MHSLKKIPNPSSWILRILWDKRGRDRALILWSGRRSSYTQTTVSVRCNWNIDHALCWMMVYSLKTWTGTYMGLLCSGLLAAFLQTFLIQYVELWMNLQMQLCAVLTKVEDVLEVLRCCTNPKLSIRQERLCSLVAVCSDDSQKHCCTVSSWRQIQLQRRSCVGCQTPAACKSHKLLWTSGGACQ